MPLPTDAVDLTHRFTNNMVALANSGRIRALRERGRFLLEEPAGVIRYRLTDIGLPADADIFFALRFHLETRGAAADLVSVVNAAVSEGRIWNIEPDDRTGTHSLTGVVRADGDGLIIYANIAGPGEVTFRIDTAILAVVPRGPLRLAFVIDPWIEQGDPACKSAYVWWYGLIAAALQATGRDVSVHYVVGDGILDTPDARRIDPAATLTAIPACDLLELYGSHRRGVPDQRQRLGEGVSSPRRQALVEMLRRALAGATDVIIACSDMQVLKDAAPEALHLFRDAMGARSPFPDEMTCLDTKGLFRNAGIADLCLDPAPRTVPAAFIDRFFPRSGRVEEALRQRDLLRSGFILLPLQVSNYFNFYDECRYFDQIELVIEAARRFADRPVVVTQHPTQHEIPPPTMAILQRMHPNIVYLTELPDEPQLSSRLLRYAAGIAAVSTGLIHQAIVCDVPVHLMGRHALERLLGHDPDRQPRQTIAWHLMTRVFHSYHYLHNPHWMWARLCVLSLYRRGVLPASFLAIDLPGTIFKVLQDHCEALERTQPA